jgi:hypothetical protein
LTKRTILIDDSSFRTCESIPIHTTHEFLFSNKDKSFNLHLRATRLQPYVDDIDYPPNTHATCGLKPAYVFISDTRVYEPLGTIWVVRERWPDSTAWSEALWACEE